MCKTNQVKIKIDGFSLKLMQDLTKSSIPECYQFWYIDQTIQRK